jgi:hypothetical protein
MALATARRRSTSSTCRKSSQSVNRRWVALRLRDCSRASRPASRVSSTALFGSDTNARHANLPRIHACWCHHERCHHEPPTVLQWWFSWTESKFSRRATAGRPKAASTNAAGRCCTSHALTFARRKAAPALRWQYAALARRELHHPHRITRRAQPRFLGGKGGTLGILGILRTPKEQLRLNININPIERTLRFSLVP